MFQFNDLAKEFKSAAEESGLYSRLTGEDKTILSEIVRDAGDIAKQAITSNVDVERERAHLDAQFLNLSATVLEDAKDVFFKVIGQRISQVGAGMLAGLI